MTTKKFRTFIFGVTLLSLMAPIALQNTLAQSDPMSDIQSTLQTLNQQTKKFVDLESQNNDLQKQADSQSDQITKSLLTSKIRSNQIEIDASKQKIEQLQQHIQSLFNMDPAKVVKYRDGQRILEKNTSIPWYGLGVNELTQKLTVDMLPKYQNKGYEAQIAKLVGPDVAFEIRYAEDTFKDWSCTSQTVECDPLVGGIKINLDAGTGCTLSLPVQKGTAWGFITAGHCYSAGTNIYQPTNIYNKIGQVDAGNSIYGGTCDCAFITKNGPEMTQKSVWVSSNVYTTMTSTPTLSAGNSAMMQGQVSGAIWGTVTGTGQTRVVNGVTFTDLVTFTGLTGTNGDSGAPIIEPVSGRYYGLLKGGNGAEELVIPWADIASNLGVHLP
jgi:anti-sigma28 factor (negative regulator of flagellin synthesis)